MTDVTEAGSTMKAGHWLQAPTPTRSRLDWLLDDDFDYVPEESGRSVQTPDQARTIQFYDQRFLA